MSQNQLQKLLITVPGFLGRGQTGEYLRAIYPPRKRELFYLTDTCAIQYMCDKGSDASPATLCRLWHVRMANYITRTSKELSASCSVDSVIEKGTTKTYPLKLAC
jgi:hypothetical protein